MTHAGFTALISSTNSSKNPSKRVVKAGSGAPLKDVDLPVHTHSGIGSREKAAQEEALRHAEERELEEEQRREEEREALINQAINQAYEQGIETGRQMVEEEVGNIIRSLASSIASLQNNAEDIISEQVRADTQDLAQSAVEVAGWMLQGELKKDPTTLFPLLNVVLEQVVTPENIVVKVNPEDLHLLRSYLAKERIIVADLVEDSHIKRGELFLEARGGMRSEISIAEAMRRALGALGVS